MQVKGGLAGSFQPSFVEPTAISVPASPDKRLGDLEFDIGAAALAQPGRHAVWPMAKGIITDFDAMERLWAACIYKRLCVYPEDHNFILTEPPLNPPEHRETTAEIMFETFDVPGLHIGVQAVLALYAGWAMAEKAGTKRQLASTVHHSGNPLTGVVIDSGDGCTHCIPVVDGYVVGSAIRSIPLAGRDVTRHMLHMLRSSHGAALPPLQAADLAVKVKEQLCYTCSNPEREAGKYTSEPGKYAREYSFVDARSGKEVSITVDHERYLGPEIFFNPSLTSFNDGRVVPLHAAVDDAVQSCAIDTRRALYGNVMLSGGSTMFRDFDKRVQKEVQTLVNARTGGSASTSGAVEGQQVMGPPQVQVVAHPLQRHAVYAGDSVLGASPAFRSAVVTRAEYEEHGAHIVRNNPVYTEW